MYLSTEGFSLVSGFMNLCLMLEKREDLVGVVLSPSLITENIWRGNFSGGVSVPLISSSETSLALFSTTAFWLGFSACKEWAGRPSGSNPPEFLSSGAGLFRNERMDFCLCILRVKWEWERGEGFNLSEDEKENWRQKN